MKPGLLRTLKHKQSKPKGKAVKAVKFCPRCRSTAIGLNPQGGLVFLGFPPSFTCRKCGYTGRIFPEFYKEKIKGKRKKK